MEYKNMDTDNLKKEIASLYHSIYVADCFGTKDLFNFELAVSELEGRGIVVETTQSIQFLEKESPDADTDVP